jgi:hypothetical protein
LILSWRFPLSMVPDFPLMPLASGFGHQHNHGDESVHSTEVEPHTMFV